MATTSESSSLSTVTSSDAESASSTPSDEIKNIVIKNNIKDIIKAFESCSKIDINPSSNDKSNANILAGDRFIKKVRNGAERQTDRVQELEKQLRQTLDRSFNGNTNEMYKKMHSSSDTTDSQEQVVVRAKDIKDDMTTKFETYVRTVRVFTDTDKPQDGGTLFSCCLLVGLMGKTPYVKSKFPKNVEVPHKIEELCFPDVVGGPMDDSTTAQCYSLVITKESGDRVYGYCRRVIPEGSKHCLPLVYCILSQQRAPRFYRRVLEEIETRHGYPDRVLDLLLHEIYHKKFPSPGQSVRFDLTKIKAFMNNEIKVPDNLLKNNCDINSVSNGSAPVNGECHNGRTSTDSAELDLNSFVVVGKTGEYGSLTKSKVNSLQHSSSLQGVNKETQLKRSSSFPTIFDDEEPSEIVLTLPQDIRYKETDLEKLCNTISRDILKKVFASLLLERKVILVSCVLSQLSSCIEALQSILYPFSWPHTLIPVLPQTLWEIVEAPTPLICGVLSVSVINDFKIENGIVIDLDEGAISLAVGDEDKILPHSLVKTWEKGLSLANSVPQKEHAHNVLLNDAFLRIFIDSCGHYKDFIVDGKFMKEEFLEHPTGKGIRRFLKWFTETTMFFMFIESMLNNSSSYPIFDKRIQIYSSPESDIIMEKMKDWKREKSHTWFD